MGMNAINWMAKQKTGDDKSKSALFWLAFHMNDKTGECFPSISTLQAEMEVKSDNTVRSALRRLRDAGFISWERETKDGLTVKTNYHLHMNGSMAEGTSASNGTSTIAVGVPQPLREGTSTVEVGTSTIAVGVPQPLRTNMEIEQGINRERNKESSMRTSGNSSAIAAVASAQAQTPYPEDFDKSLFDEAEREARSFPEPLPEPPALPPVEQPASTPARPKMAYPPCQYEKVVELYHANCKGLRRVMALTDARKRTINARWREFCKEDDLKTTAEALESFEWYFQEVSKSRFLMGYSTPGPGRDRPFKADFDWLMCPTNFLKVCEGKYSNGPKN